MKLIKTITSIDQYGSDRFRTAPLNVMIINHVNLTYLDNKHKNSPYIATYNKYSCTMISIYLNYK